MLPLDGLFKQLQAAKQRPCGNRVLKIEHGTLEEFTSLAITVEESRHGERGDHLLQEDGLTAGKEEGRVMFSCDGVAALHTIQSSENDDPVHSARREKTTQSGLMQTALKKLQ